MAEVVEEAMHRIVRGTSEEPLINVETEGFGFDESNNLMKRLAFGSKENWWRAIGIYQRNYNQVIKYVYDRFSLQISCDW